MITQNHTVNVKRHTDREEQRAPVERTVKNCIPKHRVMCSADFFDREKVKGMASEFACEGWLCDIMLPPCLFPFSMATTLSRVA